MAVHACFLLSDHASTPTSGGAWLVQHLRQPKGAWRVAAQERTSGGRARQQYGCHLEAVAWGDGRFSLASPWLNRDWGWLKAARRHAGSRHAARSIYARVSQWGVIPAVCDSCSRPDGSAGPSSAQSVFSSGRVLTGGEMLGLGPHPKLSALAA